MFSESYPRLSISVETQQRASGAQRDSTSALSRGLSRLAGRRGGWAAVGFALLTAWAIWDATCWLLERWHIR